MAATSVLLPQIVNNALTELLLQITSNTQVATQLPVLSWHKRQNSSNHFYHCQNKRQNRFYHMVMLYLVMDDQQLHRWLHTLQDIAQTFCVFSSVRHNPSFVLAPPTHPSCAGALPQELGHWFCSQNLRLSSGIALKPLGVIARWPAGPVQGFERGLKLGTLQTDQRFVKVSSALKSLNKLCRVWIVFRSIENAIEDSCEFTRLRKRACESSTSVQANHLSENISDSRATHWNF